MRIARRLVLLAVLGLAANAACSVVLSTDVFNGPVGFNTCFYGATEAPDTPGEIWFVFEEQRGKRISGCYGRIAVLGGPGSLPLRIDLDLAGTVTSVEGSVLEADISLEQTVDIRATATLDQGVVGTSDDRNDDRLLVRPVDPGVDHLFSSLLLVPGAVAAAPCPASCEELDTLVNFDRPSPPMLEMQP